MTSVGSRVAVAGIVLAVASAGCTGPAYGDPGDEYGSEYEYEASDEPGYDEVDEGPSFGEWLVKSIFDVAIDAVFNGDEDDGPGFLDDLGPLPRKRARADLVRAGAEPDPDARGVVVVARRAGRDRFVVAAAGLHGQFPAVFVEGASGAMTRAGPMATGDDGVALFDLDTRAGRALPEGAPDLEAIVGRAVEVRADGGTVLLRGVVPGLRAGPVRRRTGRFEDPATAARGSLRVRRGGAAGRESFLLRVRGFDPDAPVDLLAEAAGGSLSVAASGLTDARGRWTFVRDSRFGEPLPAGADALSSMGGVGFEIRCGDASLAGEVPLL